MPNPMYNQQVSGSGSQEQGYAASASMIITGLEKELNRKINNIKTEIVDPKIQLQALENYIQKLSATTTVDEIKKRKDDQRKGSNQSLPKRKKQGKIKTKSTPSRAKIVVFKTRLKSKSGKEKTIDPKLLREYIILEAKKQSGVPIEEQAETKKRLVEIEEVFKRDQISPELLHIYRSKIKITIKNELLSLIKNILFKNLKNPYEIFEKILSQENASTLIKIVAEGRAIDDFPLEELVGTAKNLGVNLDKWIAYWNFEKVKIQPSGIVTINPQLEEEINFKKDGFRSLYIDFLLGEGWIDNLKLRLKISKETKNLKKYGLSEEEIKVIINQAIHLAWLKIITSLKDLHLKRVLSASEEEFVSYSAKIAKLTQQAKKLTQNVSEKGQALIKGKLETLALGAAKYKLEFLKSMQNIEYQKEREKDILWIEQLIKRLGLK